jgi:hypothetical protein
MILGTQIQTFGLYGKQKLWDLKFQLRNKWARDMKSFTYLMQLSIKVYTPKSGLIIDK